MRPCDFTPAIMEKYLPDINELIRKVVGNSFELKPLEKESPVGDGKSVDILLEEIYTHKPAIIENQLEEADQEHLGKCIYYAENKPADIIIWIVSHADSSFKRVVEDYNNKHPNKYFFLIEAEALSINGKDFRVNFHMREEPHDGKTRWRKELDKKPLTENDIKKFDYWTSVLVHFKVNKEFSKEFNINIKVKKGTTENTIQTGANLPGDFSMIFRRTINRKKRIGVQLCTGNINFWNNVYSHKDKVEKITGCSLEWDKKKDRKYNYINLSKDADCDDMNDRINQFNWMMEKALLLKKALEEVF